jgi:hypothetical protein
MAHEEGAGDTLAAIKSRLDRMDGRFNCTDIKLEGIHDTLQWHGEMVKFHGHHFSTIEALLRAHGGRLDAIETTLKEHGTRFDRVDIKLAEHDARFDRVDARFDQVDETLQKILARLDAPPA